MNDLDIENRLRKTYRAVADRTQVDVELQEPGAQRPALLVSDDELAHRRRPATRTLAVAAAALLVVAGAVAVVTVAGDGDKPQVQMGPDDKGEPFLPPAPITGRYSHSAVWTGTEMIVFGGYSDDGAAAGPDTRPGDAAAYDPATRSWHRIADLPEGVQGTSQAVWTGREVVLVATDHEDPVPPGTPFGAAYDPQTDTWRLIDAPGFGVLAATPGPGRVVWTGDRVLVAGMRATSGDGLSSDAVTTATYDPATGAWEQLPDGPLSLADTGRTVWTGTELVYVGPSDDGLGAAAFDPAAKTWRELPTSPLEPRHDPLVAWTGTEVIVAGGMLETEPNSTMVYGDAAALDPATGEWTAVPDAPASEFVVPDLPATGGPVVAYASWSPSFRMLLFDADDRTWEWGPAAADLIGGTESIVAAGDELIVWGGRSRDGTKALDTGYVLPLP